MNARRRHTAPASLGARMQAQAEEAAELLKALSNPQRLRVMCLLIDGEKTVGEINAEVELSQSALSQHLAVLREGGLVQTRRESQSVYYSVAPGPVHRLMRTLHDIYCPAEGEDSRDGLC
jgi:DNA-binding transcriptional ArsR family regulator